MKDKTEIKITDETAFDDRYLFVVNNKFHLTVIKTASGVAVDIWDLEKDCVSPVATTSADE